MNIRGELIGPFPKGEERDRQVDQVTVLLKTIYLLSSVRVHMYIINNDDTIYYDILAGVRDWYTEAEGRMVFHREGFKKSIEFSTLKPKTK